MNLFDTLFSTIDRSTVIRPVEEPAFEVVDVLHTGPSQISDERGTSVLSPTVLNNRLKLLRDTQLTSHDAGQGYTLTEMGRELLEVYKPLNQWAIAWQAARKASS